MTKRRIARLSFDSTHKALMLAYKRARGGEKTTALRRLKAYVLGCLREV